MNEFVQVFLGPEFPRLLWQHIVLSVSALLLAVVIAIPLAILVRNSAIMSTIVINFGNIGRAVPSLALLAFALPLFGIGFAPALVALAALAIPPILINASIGLREVSREIMDAAKGMGLSESQILARVQLPIAAPVIFAGLRTSAVQVVASATLATFIGGGALGELIVQGFQRGGPTLLAGALSVAVLAIITEILFGGLERIFTPKGLKIARAGAREVNKRKAGGRMKNRTKLIRAVPVLLMALAVALLAACGNVGGGSSSDSSDSGDGSGPTITVGSKNFTEQYILGNMYALALENAGFDVETKLNLGSEQIADRALQNGQIDLYPEYTGTALVAIVEEEFGKDPATLDTPEQTYQEAKKLYSERDPADTMLKPAPFNNTYGIFVRREVAEREGIENLEQLAEASPDLTFVSYSEFQDRSDGYKNMQDNYPALDFGTIEIVNELGLRYQGLTSGDGDVGVGFTTDGQLTSDELVVMEDPKSIWPFYYPAPVVRSDVLEENPKMEKVLNEVSASLDVETMRELNAQVDIDQEDPEDVAEQHLQAVGILN